MRPNPLKLASVQSAAIAAPAVSLCGAHRTPDGVFDSVMRLLAASGVHLTKNKGGEPASVAPRSALKLAAHHVGTSDWIDGMTLHPIKARRGVWRTALPHLDVIFVGIDAHTLRTAPDQVRHMADNLAKRLGRSAVSIVSDEGDHVSLAQATGDLCGAPLALDLVVASHESTEVLVAAAMALSGATACSARLTVNGANAFFEDMSQSTEQSIGLLCAAELLLAFLGAHDSAERLADATDRVLNAGMCTSAAPTVLPYEQQLSASELIDAVTGKMAPRRSPMEQRSRPVLELVQ